MHCNFCTFEASTSRNPSVGQPEKKQGDSSDVTAKPSLKLTAWKPPFLERSDRFRAGTFHFLEKNGGQLTKGSKVRKEHVDCKMDRNLEMMLPL